MNLKELNIIRDRNGRFNVQPAEKVYREHGTTAARTNQAAGRMEFAGIDRLLLTLGRIHYTDLQNPSFSREIAVGLKDELLTNLKTESDVGSQLFRLIVQVVMKQARGSGGGKFELLFDDDSATNAPSAVDVVP